MTYEYECQECGHTWEEEQKISEEPRKECPRCKKQSAKRLVSGGTGFSLQGMGWFRDGYS